MQVSCTLSSKGWTLNLNGSEQKSSTKELTRLFWNKFSASDFCTVVQPFFFPTCHVLKTWFKLLVHFFNESWFIWLLVLFFNIFGDDFQGFSETAFHCTVKLLNEIYKKNRKFISCWHFFSIGTEVCHCCSTTSWRNTWQSNF